MHLRKIWGLLRFYQKKLKHLRGHFNFIDMKLYNNWNILRLILALIVLFGHLPSAGFVMHFIQQTLGLNFINGNVAVHIFLVISGFLITSSFLANPDLNSYFKKRLLRIYPHCYYRNIVIYNSIFYWQYRSKNIVLCNHISAFISGLECSDVGSKFPYI